MNAVESQRAAKKQEGSTLASPEQQGRLSHKAGVLCF